MQTLTCGKNGQHWLTKIKTDCCRVNSTYMVLKNGFVLVRGSLCLICCLVHNKRLETYFLELFIEISQRLETVEKYKGNANANMRHEWATLIDKDKNRLLSDKLDLHGFKKGFLYLSGLVRIMFTWCFPVLILCFHLYLKLCLALKLT